MRNAEFTENRRMAFRIGINLGDVVEEGERIYGDGVNIASRVEGLAEGGGICISGTVYDSIKNKLSLSYEPLGEHTVKNIKEPIRVYRMRVGPESETQEEAGPKRRRWAVLAIVVAVILVIGAVAIWNFYLRHPSVEPASEDRMAFPLPDKPSIAVLPFANMSGDPEQDYISDDLSENIISALSLSSQIFVIARNSTFTYKGKPVKVQQVAEDLGVQYVLEGSIQKSGDRIRVTAQIIDALKGHHLWSDMFDREMKELFRLQDEITKKIVNSIFANLQPIGDDIWVVGTPTDNLKAWNHCMKAADLFTKRNAEDNSRARELYKAALKLDPEYAEAMVMLGATYLRDSIYRWSDSPSSSLNSALELVQKALKINEKNASAHSVLGLIYLHQRQYDKAIAEGKRALTIAPNFAMGRQHLADTMFYSGNFDEAITLMKKALRLNPKLPEEAPGILLCLRRSYFLLGRYKETLEANNQIRDSVLRGRLPEWYSPLGFAYIYQKLGREEEARAYMDKVLKISPNMSIEMFKHEPFGNPDHLQQELDAFRKAGMPEKPGGVSQ